MRAIVWTSATMLASCSILATGGVYTPAVLVACALTWGMLPVMLGRALKERSGSLMIVPMLLLMVLLGVTRQEGIVKRAAVSFGLGADFLHYIVGAVLAGTLAWLLGCRNLWFGLLAIALSALAGGAGELLQMVMTSWRLPDLGDWALHALGCVTMVPPYLLAMGSRWSESPQVAASRCGDGAYDK